MSSLRAALILILAGGASTVYAEQITCESHQAQTEACGTFAPGGSVQLVQQLSSTPCVEGQNWGTRTSPNHDSIWVSGGCRAVFDVRAAYNGTADRGAYDSGVAYDNDDSAQYADTSHSPQWQRGFDDGQRGVFNRRADSPDYRDGHRAGVDAMRNENRYSSNSPDTDRGDTANGPRYASGDSPRRIARSACIEQAASGQPYAADQIRTGEVHWIGQGVLSVDVDTPDGPLTCTVDRDGNVRSLDSR